MPAYSQPDSQYITLLDSVKKKYHEPLMTAGVTVSLVVAKGKRNANGELAGPTLKSHGYPALAMININNQRDRVDGLADATIVIDGDQFFDLPEEKQIAVLDHELQHLEIVRDEENGIQLDDCNRPKLKMRLHDLFVGGFTAVIARHGENAVEVGQVQEVARSVDEVMAGREAYRKSDFEVA